jgi:hypothetical protein
MAWGFRCLTGQQNAAAAVVLKVCEQDHSRA